ncbi:MAG: SET domain-containing protein-lysine N-methyltransferase [Rhodothermia bacterium]|nr:SET domain-containing protein-lysine N-methyltransferase [Rhodothermia bacterium]
MAKKKDRKIKKKKTKTRKGEKRNRKQTAATDKKKDRTKVKKKDRSKGKKDKVKGTKPTKKKEKSTKPSAEKKERSTKAPKKNKKKGGKRIKKGKGPLFEVTNSPIHGTGVFALRKIRKGTVIGEYTGEIISDDEASERYVDAEMETHHTFLFAVDDDVVIDAGVGGSDVRFINHCCDPNCQSYMDDEDRVFIEAIRTIAPGEELTYDYQLDRDGTPDESWDRLYACRCGAANCRGTMLAEITEE